MSNRRVLVIAYYFPPSGGSGVQRILKFVKYLPAFGWQPVVLTLDPEKAAYPNLDPAMLEEVPDKAEVHRTASWDPYRIYAGLTNQKKESAVSVGFLSDAPVTLREKISRWIRANVFIPDARVGWYFYALKKAKKLIAQGDIDAILTTGPPHSTHLIGRALSRKFKLPWIADFRDPWVEIDFLEELPMSGPAKHWNASLEQSVLDEAAVVLTVSPAMDRDFALKKPTSRHVIYNGFDEQDFEGVIPQKVDNFVISHVGNMNAARNPEVLWKVLSTGLKEGKWEKLRIKLVGNVDGLVMQHIKQAGLTDLIERIPYCPHHEAVQHMMESSILLLPINNVFSAKGIVTGKLFEYMATGRSILGIGPPDGDAAVLIDETRTGQMFDYEDEEGVYSFLSKTYSNWINQHNETPNQEAIAKYSRKGQTGQLAEILNNLLVQ